MKPTALVLLVFAALPGCGHPPASPPPAIGERSAVDPPPPPPAVSNAPLCARPDEVIGVCQISAAGVMVQARNLSPGYFLFPQHRCDADPHAADFNDFVKLV